MLGYRGGDKHTSLLCYTYSHKKFYDIRDRTPSLIHKVEVTNTLAYQAKEPIKSSIIESTALLDVSANIRLQRKLQTRKLTTLRNSFCCKKYCDI